MDGREEGLRVRGRVREERGLLLPEQRVQVQQERAGAGRAQVEGAEPVRQALQVVYVPASGG